MRDLIFRNIYLYFTSFWGNIVDDGPFCMATGSSSSPKLTVFSVHHAKLVGCNSCADNYWLLCWYISLFISTSLNSALSVPIPYTYLLPFQFISLCILKFNCPFTRSMAWHFWDCLQVNASIVKVLCHWSETIQFRADCARWRQHRGQNFPSLSNTGWQHQSCSGFQICFATLNQSFQWKHPHGPTWNCWKVLSHITK